MQRLKTLALAIMGADKWKHLAVGLLVALALLVLMAAERAVFPAFSAAHPWFWAIINGGVCVHLAKEGTDWIDNRAARAQGEPDRHTVDPRDFLAGQLGTTAVALLALQLGLV